MKQIKAILGVALLAAFLAGPVIAQDKKETKKEAPLKEHKCTAACKDGKHMYAHGEKGHKCTDACKKMMMEKKS